MPVNGTLRIGWVGPQMKVGESQVRRGPVRMQKIRLEPQQKTSNEHSDCLSELCCVHLVVEACSIMAGDVVLGVNHEHQRPREW